MWIHLQLLGKDGNQSCLSREQRRPFLTAPRTTQQRWRSAQSSTKPPVPQILVVGAPPARSCGPLHPDVPRWCCPGSVPSPRQKQGLVTNDQVIATRVLDLLVPWTPYLWVSKAGQRCVDVWEFPGLKMDDWNGKIIYKKMGFPSKAWYIFGPRKQNPIVDHVSQWTCSLLGIPGLGTWLRLEVTNKHSAFTNQPTFPMDPNTVWEGT